MEENTIVDDEGCTLEIMESNDPKCVMLAARGIDFDTVVLNMDLPRVRQLREMAQRFEKLLEANQ